MLKRTLVLVLENCEEIVFEGDELIDACFMEIETHHRFRPDIGTESHLSCEEFFITVKNGYGRYEVDNGSLNWVDRLVKYGDITQVYTTVNDEVENRYLISWPEEHDQIHPWQGVLRGEEVGKLVIYCNEYLKQRESDTNESI